MPAPTFTPASGRPVPFRGEIFPGTGAKNISGAAVRGDYLLLVSDEVKDPTGVQVLRREGDGYAVHALIELPGAAGEIDLEAVACDRSTGRIYVTGSHARTRKIEDGRVKKVKARPERDRVYELDLAPDGLTAAVTGPKSLAAALDAHAVLAAFRAVPAKENGVDIEGLAARAGELYFGFRSPVLRDGWVPVLVAPWRDPDGAVTRYVNLGGRGVRDLAAVESGFLILAGPPAAGAGTYTLHVWDGADQLAAGAADPVCLGTFDVPGGRPEGLVVLGETAAAFDVMLLSDGPAAGGAAAWTVPKP